MLEPGDKLFRNLCKKVGYAAEKYQLIEPGDKIMVGISGGKDSLFLLESLANLKKRLPFSFEIVACHIHIKEVGYKIDVDYLSNLCQSLEIKFYIEELSVNLTENPKKAPCFVCSWHRRKRLFELTRELQCNKLALGHHLDDAIETLLMNMVYHGSVSSLPAKLKMFDGRMYLIRPMIELTNGEMVTISELRHYPKLKSQCPYGDDTKRSKARELVEQMNALNPHARKNIFRSMGKIIPEYLPNGLEKDII